MEVDEGMQESSINEVDQDVRKYVVDKVSKLSRVKRCPLKSKQHALKACKGI